MTNPVQTNPVQLCDDVEEFTARAARWAPGMPFPLLACRALDRYRSLFPDGRLPAPVAGPREGTVVSVGNQAAAAGAMLARATERRHLVVKPDELLAQLAAFSGTLVAVVGLADDLSEAGDWPGVSGASVGVVTARDLPSLACLVYRSLTTESVGEDRMFIAAHPMLEDSEFADTNEFAGLAPLRERRLKVVVLRALGKECCVGLPDGIVCGRSDPIDSPLPRFTPEYRHMPCMLGHGCHRSDLDEEQRLPAAELHATVVFTHSCSSVAVGTNAYPHHIALGLGLLEGTAVAVVGAMGVHIVQRSAQAEFEAALAEGLPLGRVVERVTERARPINGWLNRFGLLGDPGLVLPWPTGADHARPSATVATTPAATEPDAAALRTLSSLTNVVLPRLERLCWLEPGVDAAAVEAFRIRLRSITEDLHAPGLRVDAEALLEDLTDFQHRTAAQIARDIYVHGWNYGGPALDGLREVSQRPAACPNCGRDRGALVTMRHLVHDELVVQTLQCRRCGDLWWTSEAGEPTAVLEGPVDVDVRGNTIAGLTRTIRNTSAEPLSGGIGFAFAMRRFLGLPPETSAPIRVEPHGTADYTAQIDLVRYQPRPDVHTGVFVAVVNGIYIASASMMRLTLPQRTAAQHRGLRS
ncbi:hypothetical protein ACFOOM_03885 [Streptomyces echinoruber]|uniref:Uncharacterized protein n=1 Tax=Streptomyces echinoruber TaxID=68898 RepID=A0A918QSV4_9ACTN|nr:hypothetical protein [Streptomyces echinoruber]GGZ70949.1 hypothetical protein GCM10010389_05560 [Streptomyces echinoruber]